MKTTTRQQIENYLYQEENSLDESVFNIPNHGRMIEIQTFKRILYMIPEERLDAFFEEVTTLSYVVPLQGKFPELENKILKINGGTYEKTNRDIITDNIKSHEDLIIEIRIKLEQDGASYHKGVIEASKYYLDHLTNLDNKL